MRGLSPLIGGICVLIDLLLEYMGSEVIEAAYSF